MLFFRTTRTDAAVFGIDYGMQVSFVGGPQGAIAELMFPGWASQLPTFDVAEDVAAWLRSLQR
jgi:hypothetical protein